MDDLLLTTKLFVPPLRPNRVQRPRLLERMHQGLQAGFQVVLMGQKAVLRLLPGGAFQPLLRQVDEAGD